MAIIRLAISSDVPQPGNIIPLITTSPTLLGYSGELSNPWWYINIWVISHIKWQQTDCLRCSMGWVINEDTAKRHLVGKSTVDCLWQNRKYRTSVNDKDIVFLIMSGPVLMFLRLCYWWNDRAWWTTDYLYPSIVRDLHEFELKSFFVMIQTEQLVTVI